VCGAHDLGVLPLGGPVVLYAPSKGAGLVGLLIGPACFAPELPICAFRRGTERADRTRPAPPISQRRTAQTRAPLPAPLLLVFG
jgi:hypothetical protein